MSNERPPSSEDLERLSKEMTWEQQWDFLQSRDLSLHITPSTKRGTWNIAVTAKDGSTITETFSGRREAAIGSAVALASRKSE